eukprot:PhM_4_TR7159/c0_g1_i1/m.21778
MLHRVLSASPTVYSQRVKNVDVHTGERAVHAALAPFGDGGSPFDLSDLIEPYLSPWSAQFFTGLPTLAMCTLDPKTLLPVATLLLLTTGDRLVSGVQKSGQINLQTAALISRDDPFLRAFRSKPPTAATSLFAAVGVDYNDRRRTKLSGTITGSTVSEVSSGTATEGRVRLDLALHGEEVLGNCPKYIQIMALRPRPNAAVPKTVVDAHADAENPYVYLDQRCRDVINRCSTTYLSTRHISNEDTSAHDVGINHRGGPKGFVRVWDTEVHDASVAATTKVQHLVLPDFSGNRLFQSLGNIQNPGDGVASLLLVDFDTGTTLHVAGAAQNVFGPDATRIMPGVRRLTTIKVEHITLIENSLPVELARPETPSPYNPKVRLLRSELDAGLSAVVGSDLAYASQPVEAKIAHVDILTPTVRRFTLELAQPLAGLRAGGHVVVDCSSLVPPPRYAHMRPDAPRSLNDDYVRTWTVSNAPTAQVAASLDDGSTAVSRLEITVRLKENGAVTPKLFELHQGAQSGASASSVKVLGFGNPTVPPPVASLLHHKRSTPDELDATVHHHLWIAGGVGITPCLAMAAAITSRAAGRGDASHHHHHHHVSVLLALRQGDEALARPLLDVATLIPDTFVSVQIFTSPSSRLGQDNLAAAIASVKQRYGGNDTTDSNTNVATHVFYCGPQSLEKDVRTWAQQTKDVATFYTESFDF